LPPRVCVTGRADLSRAVCAGQHTSVDQPMAADNGITSQRRDGGILSCVATVAVVIMMKHWYIHSLIIRLFARWLLVRVTFHAVMMMMMMIEQSVHFHGKLPLLG